MAGKKGKSGRRKYAGKYYRFGFRFQPGIDPPELGELLQTITKAPLAKRADILRAALLGGAVEATRIANAVEDDASRVVLDDLSAAF